MLKRLVMLVAVAALFVPALAVAQDMPESGAAQQQEGAESEPEKETVYDFEDDDVTGSLVKPEGEDVQAQTHGKTSSLIQIRSDFVPEMLESVEEL